MSMALPSATATEGTRATRTSIRRHLLAGTVLIVLLAGGLGGWAATTAISGALIAPQLLCGF